MIPYILSRAGANPKVSALVSPILTNLFAPMIEESGSGLPSEEEEKEE